MASPDWILWQLADSAFPAGGYTQSLGLEAAFQEGQVRGAAQAEAYVGQLMLQAGRAGLPLLGLAWQWPGELAGVNARCHIFLSNHVANRASRAQGRAFAMACREIFQLAFLPAWQAAWEAAEPGEPHFAPLFGAVAARLGLDLAAAQRLYLYLAARDGASAAVRLGLLGSFQAQRLLRRLGDAGRDLVERLAREEAAAPAQACPVQEIFQARHDLLERRQFQS